MDRIETRYTTYAVCPHCGEEDQDCWEMRNDGETDCGYCGKPYFVERHVDVTYSTHKIAPANAGEGKE